MHLLARERRFYGMLRSPPVLRTAVRDKRKGVLCTPIVPASMCTELWSMQNLNQAGYLPRCMTVPKDGDLPLRAAFEPPGTSTSPPAQNHTPHANDEITTNLLRRLRPLHHVIH